MGDALKIVTIFLASMLCGVFSYLVIDHFAEEKSGDRNTAFMVGHALSAGICVFIIIAAWTENKVCLMIAFICAIVMAVIWFVFAIMGVMNKWYTIEIIRSAVFGGISVAIAAITFFTGFKNG